jgi:hypothetical protein
VSGYTYLRIFEIFDQDRPLSVLRAEACLDLDALAAEDGARIVGDPNWAVAGDRLVVWAPARPLTAADPRPGLPGGRTPQQTIAHIQRLLADNKLGINEVAYRTGVAPATVRLYQERRAA